MGNSFDVGLTGYPDTIFIKEQKHQAWRNMNKGVVFVPYTSAPDIGIGDNIMQKLGQREIFLQVIDLVFEKNITHKIGTEHPNLVVLKVENMTSKEYKAPKQSSTINIGSVTGEQIQVGNKNSQVVNISIQQLVEELAKSSDPEAKNLLKKLLENSTVGSLVGAGASALIETLSK